MSKRTHELDGKVEKIKDNKTEKVALEEHNRTAHIEVTDENVDKVKVSYEKNHESPLNPGDDVTVVIADNQQTLDEATEDDA